MKTFLAFVLNFFGFVASNSKESGLTPNFGLIFVVHIENRITKICAWEEYLW
jgi:hypothetical protein